MTKNIKQFFNEHRIAYWAGVLTIISVLFSIGGGLFWGAAKLFLNSCAQEYRIQDLQEQLLQQNKKIESLKKEQICLIEENSVLKSEPNQDNLRNFFWNSPIKKSRMEIFGTKSLKFGIAIIVFITIRCDAFRYNHMA